MSTPYLGEIRYLPYASGRTPIGWQKCDGSLLAISQYDALYALIGTTYGGDGVNTFAVPDLQGRVAVAAGSSSTGTTYTLGERAGSETVTLLQSQMPSHNHLMEASGSAGTQTSPVGAVFAASPSNAAFYTNATTATAVAMNATAVAPAGQSQPHDNCAPTVAIYAFIATQGIYPSQN